MAAARETEERRPPAHAAMEGNRRPGYGGLSRKTPSSPAALYHGGSVRVERRGSLISYGSALMPRPVQRSGPMNWARIGLARYRTPRLRSYDFVVLWIFRWLAGLVQTGTIWAILFWLRTSSFDRLRPRVGASHSQKIFMFGLAWCGVAWASLLFCSCRLACYQVSAQPVSLLCSLPLFIANIRP